MHSANRTPSVLRGCVAGSVASDDLEPGLSTSAACASDRGPAASPELLDVGSRAARDARHVGAVAGGRSGTCSSACARPDTRQGHQVHRARLLPCVISSAHCNRDHANTPLCMLCAWRRCRAWPRCCQLTSDGTSALHHHQVSFRCRSQRPAAAAGSAATAAAPLRQAQARDRSVLRESSRGASPFPSWAVPAPPRNFVARMPALCSQHRSAHPHLMFTLLALPRPPRRNRRRGKTWTRT